MTKYLRQFLRASSGGATSAVFSGIYFIALATVSLIVVYRSRRKNLRPVPSAQKPATAEITSREV